MFWRSICWIAIVFGFTSRVACSGEQQVHLSVTFFSESRPVRIGASLQVVQHFFPRTNWWTTTGANNGELESVLVNVVNAIKEKDRAGLLSLAHPAHGRDPKRFDEQATALFSQFEQVEIVSIEQAFKFDGLVIFFVELRHRQRAFFTPFVFQYTDAGSLGFLPYRTELLTFHLVKDWFEAARSKQLGGQPPLAPESSIRSATHCVSLVPPDSNQRFVPNPSLLYLRGTPLDHPTKAFGTIAEKVKLAVGGMKATITNTTIDEFVRYLTPEGGNRLKVWYSKAPAGEIATFRHAVSSHTPFFVFDASPLAIVYTTADDGVIQVLYFTIEPDGRLVWVNSSHATIADRIFKKGPLYDAALRGTPFSTIQQNR